MSKQILVNSSPYETRVATLTDGEIKELHIEREEDRNVVGNIYKGVVKRVLPGMQAAFLELGLERTAFLYVDDIIDEPFGTDVDWEEEDDDDEDDGDDSEDSPRNEDSDEDDDEDSDEDEDSDDEDGDSDEDDGPESRGNDSDENGQDAPPHFAHRDVERDESFLPTEESLREESESEAKDLGPATIDAKSKSGSAPAKPPAKSAKGDDSETEGETEALSKEPKKSEEASPNQDETQTSEASDDSEATLEYDPSSFGEKDPVTIEYFSEPGMRRVPKTKGAKLRAMEASRGNADRDRSDGDRDRSDRGRGRDRSERDDSREARSDRGRDRGGRRDEEGSRDKRGERDGNRSEREGRDSGRSGRGGDRKSSRGRSSSGGSRPRRAARARGRGGRRPTRRERRKVDIQDLLKEGQEILVQVAKAPIGTKGARLTTHISLPGRNLVLMPTVKHLGISRRIESDRERRRLRDIFTKRIRPEKDVGFIIRTVASGKTFRELKADAEYLLKVWDKIQDHTKKKKAPALIHEDLGLALKTVRDDFTEDVDSYVIDNPKDYERVVDFITPFSPKLKGRVKLFRGPSQLFEHYGIEAEISRALGKKVWLKSGGYLLVDQSEALTAIDVNTGRYVGSKSLEETILKTNLEAVKEISYQLRVRNIGGIIIMDLIDMESAKNRRIVFDALQKVLSEDKARTNILKISELGLVEMTRKRTHEDLVRYLTEGCHYCDGRGYHKSRRTIVFEIFREIEKEAIATEMGTVVVFANPEVVKTVEKDEKKHVGGLEERFEKKILVKTDLNFHVEQFEVFSKP